MTESKFKVVIVGGGLVGALEAVVMAKRGYDVHVYELRPDSRNEKLESGRSINLALSMRGITALKKAGVEKEILESLIPMKGRMIHGLNGSLSSQRYGEFNEAIYSVDRKFMNDHLLNKAQAFENVQLNFGFGLKHCDFETNTLYFQGKEQEEIRVKADLIIGADGIYSKVRQHLGRITRFDLNQEYIDHSWCELTIPAIDGDYAMDPNHLHIWPRHSFMMIALPNNDKSFTATLFMPFSKFETITDSETLLEFFDETFPDSIKLLGRESLVKTYFENPKGSLMTLKCKPYHYKDKVIIIGDAAHAMVPFYGQGMNSGFEDVTVLNSLFNEYCSNEQNPSPAIISKILSTFSEKRHKDVVAMCDLAMYNYVEMRSDVVSLSYLLRKKVEGYLHSLFPTQIIPLYTMVSFTNIPYSEVIKRWKMQSSILFYSIVGITSISLIGIGVGLLRFNRIRSIVFLVDKWKLLFNKF